MSIRTTVTLDDDVVANLKQASLARGVPFRVLLNDAVRSGLMTMQARPERRALEIRPRDLGVFPGVNYDCIAAVIEAAEGGAWR